MFKARAEISRKDMATSPSVPSFGAAAPYLAKLVIGGQDCDAASGATFERIGPATGMLATLASAATADDVMRAADAAAAAFPAWSGSIPAFRRALLEKAARLLAEREEQITAIMMAETGATQQWCRFNVRLGSQIFFDAAAMTTHVSGAIVPTDQPGVTAFAIRQPAGVCLAIAPWNAPIILGVRSIAIALACGNTVILKSSELSPATHRAMVDVLVDAGFPAGVVNLISNAPADASAIVEALIAHPVVRRINFTGSTRVGRIIAQIAARHLKRCLLELGGKAAFIVLDDADLDEAVKAAAFGAFFNQGQICMSAGRHLVHRSVAHAYAAKLTERARKLHVADPNGGPCHLGPLINQRQTDRVHKIVSDTVAAGAQLLTGGTHQGNLYQPTVLLDVKPEMPAFSLEIFGPVAPITVFDTDEEAIALVNSSEYGLAAAIHTASIPRALHIAEKIRTGMVHINDQPVNCEPQVPFGGMGASGTGGRFGGPASVEQFTQAQWVSIAGVAAQYPF